MQSEKKSRGGSRPGAGRKPSPEPLQPYRIRLTDKQAQACKDACVDGKREIGMGARLIIASYLERKA